MERGLTPGIHPCSTCASYSAMVRRIIFETREVSDPWCSHLFLLFSFFFGDCHPQTLWRVGTCSSHSSSAYASLYPHIPPMLHLFRIHLPDRSRIPEARRPSLFEPALDAFFLFVFGSILLFLRDGKGWRFQSQGRVERKCGSSLGCHGHLHSSPDEEKLRRHSSVPAPPPSWKVGDTSKTKGCRRTPLRSSGACKGIESADGNPLENKGRRSNSPARRCDGWESKTPGKDTVVASIASHGTKPEPSSCRVRTIDI